MTSFINTMFVPKHSHPQLHPHPHSHPPPPQPYLQSPRPLPALQSNVLAASESCAHLSCIANATTTTTTTSSIDCPMAAYQSPLQRHIERVQLHDMALKADFLTRSNSNARSGRGTAFQPQTRKKGTNSWQLKQFAEATLGSGSLRKVVQLPEGEDRDEWLAVNVVDFYNQINLLYGAITEFCSPQSCPEMKATDEFEYLWHDPPAFPKPTRLPAPTYISHLLAWTSNHLSNSAVFPTHPGVPFPSNFQQTIRTIFKRLYRIYAHIYCHHYAVIRGLGLEAHLNTGFKHYVLFVEEFGLADEKGNKKGEWYGPLGELVESMLRSD